jgi:DNA-binding SARP family transcriptional activator
MDIRVRSPLESRDAAGACGEFEHLTSSIHGDRVVRAIRSPAPRKFAGGRLEFRILGPLEVIGPDGPAVVRGNKRRGLLAYLLVHAGEGASLDRLVADLYDERSSAGARGTVQTYLSQLRKLLAEGSGVTLETRPSGYALCVPADCLDAGRFERLCAEAATEADASTRLAMLDAALDLWRGAPLAEFAGSAWADVEATRLDALRLQALQRRIDA